MLQYIKIKKTLEDLNTQEERSLCRALADLSHARTNVLLSRRLCSVTFRRTYNAQNGEENTHSSIVLYYTTYIL